MFRRFATASRASRDYELLANLKASINASNLPAPRLDIKSIVKDPVAKSHNVFIRNSAAWLPAGAVHTLCGLYSEHKDAVSMLSKLRHEQRKATECIRQGTISNMRKTHAIEEALELKRKITDLSRIINLLEEEMNGLALAIPNDTHPDVPLGPAASAQILMQHEGPRGLLPRNNMRDHVSVARELNLIDLEAGAKVTGSSWPYLLNEAALLEQALISYTLSVVLKRSFTMVSAPDVVRDDIALRCGFHPREERTALQQFYTLGPTHPSLVLSGTAEIPLAGLYANSVLDLSSGPKKLVAFGRAFRAEAGARGKETKGLYRLHQFSKLELFAICEPEHSENLMEEMLAIQTEIYTGLKIPFRVLDMPSEELGASAFRKYDVESWMPGRGDWGEISSLSNCTDYQSRRLHIRYRPFGESRESLQFTHTLNGTALAVPRILISLLENGVCFETPESEEVPPVIQRLELPNVLEPFWLGSASAGKAHIHWS